MKFPSPQLGRPNKYTPETIHQLFEYRMKGMSLREIEKLTGVPNSTISVLTNQRLKDISSDQS